MKNIPIWKINRPSSVRKWKHIDILLSNKILINRFYLIYLSLTVSHWYENVSILKHVIYISFINFCSYILVVVKYFLKCYVNKKIEKEIISALGKEHLKRWGVMMWMITLMFENIFNNVLSKASMISFLTILGLFG